MWLNRRKTDGDWMSEKTLTANDSQPLEETTYITGLPSGKVIQTSTRDGVRAADPALGSGNSLNGLPRSLSDRLFERFLNSTPNEHAAGISIISL